MNIKRLFLALGLLIVFLLGACSVSPAPATATPVLDTPTPQDDKTATLNSLQMLDDFPLYSMQYYGEYASRRTTNLLSSKTADSVSGWGCSLFTILLDNDHLLYGRNFDWRFSPALLLFTDSPDGYASVSMVDIEYLGFTGESVFNLTDLSIEEREGLLDAPFLPFDGMNEHGLTIAMAAVPESDAPSDPSKDTIGSIGIIREVLDHARTVDEAVEIMESYNIDFDGGPTIHYLIADVHQDSALVEFYDGEMRIIVSDQPWHLATNFLYSSVDSPEKGGCWRYNTIDTELNETQGLIGTSAAMELLGEVSQGNTQWSVVYDMVHREMSVVMGRNYEDVYTFSLTLNAESTSLP